MEGSEAVGMVCPNCRVDLVMAERHGVEIDYCPKCRGVWLDRGELDKIVDHALATSIECLKNSVAEVKDRGLYPGYGTKDLKWKVNPSGDWTSGFYPGPLWAPRSGHGEGDSAPKHSPGWTG